MTSDVDATRTLGAVVIGTTSQVATGVFGSSLDDFVALAYDESGSDAVAGAVGFVGLAAGPGMADAVRAALSRVVAGGGLTVAVEIPGDPELGRSLREEIAHAGARVTALRRFGDRPCLVFAADQPDGDDPLLDSLLAFVDTAPDPVAVRQEAVAAEWSAAAEAEQARREQHQRREKTGTSGQGGPPPRRRPQAEPPPRSRLRGLVGAALAVVGGETRGQRLARAGVLGGVTLVLLVALVVAFGLVGGADGALVGLALGLIVVTVAGAVLVLVAVQRSEAERTRQLVHRTASGARSQAQRSQHRDQKLRRKLGNVDRRVREQGRVTSELQQGLKDSGTQLDRTGRTLQNQLQATANLFQMVQVRAAIPALGEWTASADLLVELLTRLVSERPRVVVESGSGVSTVLLALAAKQYGVDAKIVALEHDAEYAAKTRELLELHGVADRAEVRLAPFAPTGIEGHRTPWYDQAALADLADVGLVLVDGPPASTGTASRYPLVPLLKDRFAQQCTIFVDDTNRPADAEVVRRWQDELTDFEVAHLSLDKGAAVMSRAPLG